MTLSRLVACFAALIGSFLSVQSAPAAFTDFLPFPYSTQFAPVDPNISCVSHAPGRAICAALRDNSAVVSRFTGNRWTDWVVLQGRVNTPPSCTALGEGKALCASRGSHGGLSVARFEDGLWSWWRPLGGRLGGAPSCAAYRDGAAICAARSVDGRLLTIQTNGLTDGPVTHYEPLVTTSPRCVAHNANRASFERVVCTYGVADGGVRALRFAPGQPVEFVDLGGRATSETLCSDLGAGRQGELMCATRGTGFGFEAQAFAGGAFEGAGWQVAGAVDGDFSSAMSCASYAPGKLACAMMNASLYTTTWADGAFTPPVRFGGGPFPSAPSCFTIEAGRVMCVAVGYDGVPVSTFGP